MAAGTRDASQVRAGIYTRISLALTGDTTKTDDQERICRNLAERLAWPVAEVYTDHSLSAWKHNRKRPGWDKMLADAEAGRINAIITYHSDRLVRQGWDLEVLIRLAEGKGILLASPTGTKNLDSAEDRFVMRIEAAVATKSSDDTSRRKKAQFDRMRRAGLVRSGGGGGRCFGFESDGITHRPEETDLIRTAAALVLAGHSLGSVTRKYAGEGVTTTAGNPLNQVGLRRILMLPRMAGLMPDGVSKAAWEPVLERSEWEAVCALLHANTPGRRGGNGAIHLLSGIARCGPCGGPMWAGSNKGAAAYRCFRCGKTSRSEEHLDAYVSAATVTYLNRDDWPAAQIPAEPGRATEYATLTTARAELEVLIADHTTGALPQLLARLASVDRRLAELSERSADHARLEMIGGYRGITDEQFAALPLSAQRSLVSACLDVTVLPARPGAGFHPEFVELRRR